MRVALLPAIAEDIGLGHLQRCVTLARALRASGHQPAIVIDLPNVGTSDAVCGLVPDGIEVVRTVEEASDEPDRGRRLEWAVVDDYAADASSDRAWRRSAERVLVLDDHASRERDADVLLSQALLWSWEDYVGRVPDGCEVLAGPRYLLVRPEFGAHVSASTPTRAGHGSRNIFVSMGGTDAGRSLERVLLALARPPREEPRMVHVMISTLSRSVAGLDDLVAGLPYECLVHRDLRDPVALMASCDIAITAGGMTSLELTTLGVPAIVVPSTPLQADAARVLMQHAEVYVIDAESVGWENELLDTLSSVGRPRGARGPRFFDGAGAERVVRVMERLALQDAAHG